MSTIIIEVVELIAGVPVVLKDNDHRFAGRANRKVQHMPPQFKLPTVKAKSPYVRTGLPRR